MTLGELTLLLMIVAIAALFWRTRAMAEIARAYLSNYCEKNQIQLLSVARNSLSLSFKTGKLDWRASFIFEFSGNREDKYTGTLTLEGKRVASIDMPAFKVN